MTKRNGFTARWPHGKPSLSPEDQHGGWGLAECLVDDEYGAFLCLDLETLRLVFHVDGCVSDAFEAQASEKIGGTVGPYWRLPDLIRDEIEARSDRKSGRIDPKERRKFERLSLHLEKCQDLIRAALRR